VIDVAYSELLEPLREICAEASAAILSHYHGATSGESQTKADNSPVTAADIAAHEILLSGLAETGLPVLSEESAAQDMERRRDWPRFWMVDPLDGTREFLERTGEFTINIALVEGHRPCFGMIALPGTGAVYAGAPGEGAWRYSDDGWSDIHCRELRDQETLVVLTSRRHRGDKLNHTLDKLCRRESGVERRYIGSALKFCLLAEGSADFYPRYSPCSEWDTAAGQALLEAAGGAVLEEGGAALSYNARDSLLNPHFLALGDPNSETWTRFAIFAE
jgi:3'(2'), 5'-bisphosphate nucleotidase